MPILLKKFGLIFFLNFFFTYIWMSSFLYLWVSRVLQTSHFFLCFRALAALLHSDICMLWNPQGNLFITEAEWIFHRNVSVQELCATFSFYRLSMEVSNNLIKKCLNVFAIWAVWCGQALRSLSAPCLSNCVSKALFSNYDCQNRILLKGPVKIRHFRGHLAQKKTIFRENLM